VRSGISIVPQSPDLFEGTLRENIDPVGEHPDVDIWVALDQVSSRFLSRDSDMSNSHFGV
jgi:ABC-type multidrug transport system fused ATPase/permease subunit